MTGLINFLLSAIKQMECDIKSDVRIKLIIYTISKNENQFFKLSRWNEPISQAAQPKVQNVEPHF